MKTTTLLGLLLTCAVPLTADYGLREAKQFTVLIGLEGLEGHGRGSGILVDETHVLTCAHMTDSRKDEFFVYTFPLGKVVKARVEAVDKADDLALLVLDSSVPVVVRPTFQETVEDGDSVRIIGNALGCMKWVVTHGVISGEDRGDILSDAAINPGDSGGPWINDAGEIIAMTDWRINPATGPGMAGGISAKQINRFFRTLAMQRALAEALFKLTGGVQ